LHEIDGEVLTVTGVARFEFSTDLLDKADGMLYIFH